MSFFKNVISSVGGFFKKAATSTVGKSVLGLAATVVGGPAAGLAVTKATGLLGEKQIGEMAAKVISDGTVKVDKVKDTLASYGIPETAENIQAITDALKNAATGISQKSITVSGSSASSDNDKSNSGSFMDKIKSFYYKVKNWIVENWKTILIIASVVGGLVLLWYVFFSKNKKYRV